MKVPEPLEVEPIVQPIQWPRKRLFPERLILEVVLGLLLFLAGFLTGWFLRGY